MSLFPALRPATRQDPIPESKLKTLGSDPRYDYAEYAGSEYAITRRPISPEEHPRRAGELFVTRKRVEMIDGSPWTETATHLALPVASGTWAKIEARQAQRKPATQPARTWDALAEFRPRRSDPYRLLLSDSPADPTVHD